MNYSILEPGNELSISEHKEMIELYKYASEGGVREANYNLTKIYELQGENKNNPNLREALKYSLKFNGGFGGMSRKIVDKIRMQEKPTAIEKAESGNMKGFYELGHHFLIKNDRKNSESCFKICAESGNPDCMIEYASRIEERKSYGAPEANIWYKDAVLKFEKEYKKNKHPAIAFKLARSISGLVRTGTDKVREKEIINYYELAAAGGITGAYDYLARYHSFGSFGLKKNPKKSFEYHYKAGYEVTVNVNENIDYLSLNADGGIMREFAKSDANKGYGVIPESKKINPTSPVILRRISLESLKNTIVNSSKVVVLFAWAPDGKNGFNQLVRLTELKRICDDYGDNVQLISFIKYFNGGGTHALQKELRLMDMISMKGEHYAIQQVSNEGDRFFMRFHPKMKLVSGDVLLYQQNKNKRPYFLNEKITEKELRKLIESKIK